MFECNEDQHKTKEYTSCDSRRTMELFKDLGNRPIVVIDFNPDKYKENNKKVKGAFYKDESGAVKVDKKEFDRRCVILKKEFYFWLNFNEIPDKEITIIKLFYDQ